MDNIQHMQEICDLGLSTLSDEMQAYENSTLKESEKELLLLLDISDSPVSYHCLHCGTEVYPNFPTPIAFCSKCKEQVNWRKDNHWEQNITFNQIIQLTFNKAKNIITNMPLKKRINMLKELDKHLISLYDATKAYNDQMFGKSMSPKDFMKIMGKIKHLEILQSWLFGVE